MEDWIEVESSKFLLSFSQQNVISGNNFTNNQLVGNRAVACYENLIAGNLARLIHGIMVMQGIAQVITSQDIPMQQK